MAPRNRLYPILSLLLLLLLATSGHARKVKKSTPPLYTGDFGDCLAGQSLLALTRFDLAYDAGNETVAFHLEGTSNVKNKFVMLHLSIDGCKPGITLTPTKKADSDMPSLCPMNSATPIAASTVLPMGVQSTIDLSTFPFNLPDYDGSAKLQIYTTTPNHKEIGCFQASLTNNHTFSHPWMIGPILGVFTLAAMLASFLTAAYGISVTHMRMHHAHSLSVLVVFETLQAVFFSGALAVDWPPMLAAWWSNFAWSAGLIGVPGMVRSVNGFAGVVGDAAGVGNGLPLRMYGRSLDEESSDGVSQGPAFNSSFFRDYAWSGRPAAPGLPLPGTWEGFPAALSVVNLPVADAFLVGLIWVLIAMGLVTLAVASLKFLLGVLVFTKKIKEDRLLYFRNHWTGYLGHALQRTLVIAFFAIMTLSVLQFTIRPTVVGPVAVAAVVFTLVLVGITAQVAVGCRTRTRGGRFGISSDRVVCYHEKMLGRIPGLALILESTAKRHGMEVRPVFSIPLFRVCHTENEPDQLTVHHDKSFISKFGWLTARYRGTRWWFLAYHVGYLFCRAALLGAGWQSPHVQVYGVLVLDILNFVLAASLVPFEGARNTAMEVWILSICKIITTGISTAFLPESNTSRSQAAALGIAIIVIQALTVAALLILIILSVISSFLSLMRNREIIDPDWLEPIRVRYFTEMETKARETLFDHDMEIHTPAPTPTRGFSVISIQRRPKIEDEDEDITAAALELGQTPDDSSADNQLRVRRHSHGSHGGHSRTSSVRTRLSTGSLPRAARPYRASWSSREFREHCIPTGRPDSVLTDRLSGITCVVVTDCDASDKMSWGEMGKPRSSRGSLIAPSSVSRSSSIGSWRHSRESVSSHTEGRRPPTALPEAPEPPE
ncbi:hypothetical protein CHGG_06563 [Chaetomium globosum CBS 148.51]|uniref:ML-like domain-containing protein n=1 Tax=Chaetomium globosum (strain ATCC 6205 / CBS 148.51 / DSM 1962 / NBRC 6347 / NRRL 1970) TaxID=306901 RepID=Q2H452_CHAGB|nr:uncharacterized protein CHGG_06563 [Chaetomium globosum CBS 148.51]EAQ89944.1 hypothetical protein CHGG_06563 [Chaetomium globosum CBS 148.51]